VGDLLNFNGSMTRRAHHSPPRFLLCLARLEHPLRSGSGLGAPDTVLGCAEHEESLERGTGAENVRRARKTFERLFGGRDWR
jgi:hypothetical protein